MGEHKAVVVWERGGAAFLEQKYSRGHRWLFDGGLEVPASSSPDVVKPPLSVVAAVDPEEALIASLSSCHMLWFLALASKRGFVVDSYRDEAVGALGKDERGRTAMVRVTLRPRVTFAGEKRPTGEDVAAMHHEAHEKCFIANSVKSEVVCEPAGGV
jgi:organic hydroperoxide reductase OsmC/OhrA